MQLVKDNRTGKVYKTKYPIEDDTLRMLHQQPFLNAGVMSYNEGLTDKKCIEKWPFIEVLGNVDGRTAGAKEHDWFTWLVVIEG